jgi:ABC-2 type transport system ATP-binding protein
MNQDVLIKVEDVSRYYGPNCAVDHISFEVKRGEVLGFLGPNGAGKSTTMQMITGNLAPSEGRILINNIDILDKPKQAKRDLGFLPEIPPLYKELTVAEFLKFCAKLNRIPGNEIKTAVERAMERCGLSHVAKKLIHNLSKGYQQRVGIAQAIIHLPSVVILDEPTVGLDPIQIREIRELIRELGNDHSVILSTHILPEVQATCDRVQIINQGELVLSDDIRGLQMRMESSSHLLGFSNQPQIEELQNLPDVLSVDQLDTGRVRIHHAPDKNPAPAIVQASVKHNWGLLELTPEKMSLEDVFVNITRTEHHTDKEPKAS